MPITTNLLKKRADQYSAEEQIELVRKSQSGDLEARDKLIMSTMPFVINMATRIFNIRRPSHIELDDLIDTGFFGIDRAINKFNLNKKNNFLTYASYWIKNFIDIEIHKCQAYRVPTSVQRLADSGKLKESMANCVRLFKPMLVVDHSYGPGILDESVSHEDLVDLDEDICCLRGLVNSLDERSKRLVKFRLSGMSIKDIGKREGCTRDIVRKHLDIAKKDMLIRVAVNGFSLP